MSRLLLAAPGALVSLLLAAPALLAQQGETQCTLNQQGRPTTRLSYRRAQSGAEDLFVGGGALVECPARGITLSSDSAEYYGDRGVWYLIGTVRYREPRLSLDSRRLTYWMAEERLVAEGNVVSRLPSGTTMRGPQAEYFRAVPGVRARARMIAPGRPRFELVQTDSAGEPQEPVQLIADRVVMEGDSLVYARGQVEITRPDVFARGDSAVIDSGREWARLMRDPSIEGRAEEPFTLSGDVIDLFSTNRSLRRVLSVGTAVIESEDLDLRSDTIDLRLADDKLQRAHAWGPSRARAISQGSDILADSLDVLLPDQRLTEVRAIGGAFAESTPDTSLFRTEERDWLRGDSLIAWFDTIAAPVARAVPVDTTPPGARAADTVRTSQLRELVAVGDARSFYQIAPEDTSEVRPSVNYVRGREILVNFREGQVRRVVVTGKTAGVLIQPGVVGEERPDAGQGGAPTLPPPQSAVRPPGAGRRERAP